MENKDRLDEFLQRKFAEDDPAQRFDFREEYWLQAQALLDAEARRRRRFLWWWLGGLGGLALTAACWWLVAGPGHPERNPAPLARETRGYPAAPRDSVEGAPATGAAGFAGPETRSAATRPVPARAGAALRPSEKNGATDRSRGAEARGARQPVRAKRGFSNIKNSEAAMPPARKTSRQSLENQKGVSEKTVPSSPTAIPPENPSNPLETLPADTSAAPSPAPKESSLPPLLPLPLRPLPRILPHRPLPVAAPPKAPIADTEPHRRWEKHLGVVLSVSTPTGYLGQEKAGFGLGLTVGLHRRGSRLSGHAGLQWRRLNGALPDSLHYAPEEQTYYSFGYLRERIQRRMTGLERLEIPLSVQYDFGKFKAELGASAGVLLRLSGREDRLRSGSLAPDPAQVSSEKVNLKNEFFTSTNLALFGGGLWEPLPGWQLGLRLHYQPGALLRTDPDGAAGRRHGIWGELRGVYLF